jgi:hypothetical protein
MDLKSILTEELKDYSGEALNGWSYLLQDTEGNHFSILDVGFFDGERVTGVSLIVIVTDEHIIIERDQNDKPLFEALIDAGVPRENIILGYAGEPLPEGVL